VRKAKRARKLIWFIDDTVNFAVLVVLMVILAYGCYSLWDARQIYHAASSTQYEIYKPDEKDTRSFSQLRSINPDVFGWLTVYGTGIDYPLLQGEDNWEYLNKAADGSQSLSGAIFLDSENSTDFTDYNNLIHGHHMDQSAMFGDITEFEDAEFFDEHMYGNLFINGRNHGIIFFAYIVADAYDDDIFVGPIEGAGKQQEYLKMLQLKAMNVRDAKQADAKQILLLSTCSSDMTNGRSVLVGYISDRTYVDGFITGDEKREHVTLDKLVNWEEISLVPLWIWLFLLLIILIIIRFVFDEKSRKKRRERAMQMQSCNVKGNDYDKSPE